MIIKSPKILFLLTALGMATLQAACHAEKAPGIWQQAVATVAAPDKAQFSPPTSPAKTILSEAEPALRIPSSQDFRSSLPSSGNTPASQVNRFETQYHLPTLADDPRPIYSRNTYYGGAVTLSQADVPAANFRTTAAPQETSSTGQLENSTSPSSNGSGGTTGGAMVSRSLDNSPAGNPASLSTVPASAPSQTPNTRVATGTPMTPKIVTSEKSNPEPRPTAPTTLAEKSSDPMKVATRSATFEMTSKLSGEGILGSAVEPVVLPSFGAVFVTLFGQAENFEKLSPKSLDYSVWFLEGMTEQYEKMATARYFLKKVFLPETEIPTLPDCKEEKLDSGRIEVTCQGKLPQADGQMLRLIVCGKPDREVLEPNTTNRDHSLADFIDRAYIQGDQSLWDLELCSERRYVDYVFKGADMQIRFPLEQDKVYFLSQYPRDFLEKQKEYGEPVPNHLGIHDRTYPTSQAMSRFLYRSRIVQVVVAAPQGDAMVYGAKPGQKHFSYNYARKDSDSAKSSRTAQPIPNNEYCQSVFDWEDSVIDQELELFRLVNQQRAKKTDCGEEGIFDSAPPLSLDSSLLCAARRHSVDMAEQDYFSHYNLLGQSEWERILIASMQPLLQESSEDNRAVFPITGENISKGSIEPAVALKEWLASDGHCANLMNPIFTHMGAGIYLNNPDNPFATLTLGTEWK